MQIAIIGAGAAGCFAAINLKRLAPATDIIIYESGNKPLAKVAVTGGGRCNLTNTFHEIGNLATAYPRGDKLMKRLLSEFGPEETCRWFEHEGVKLTVQEDECVFPRSQNAMEIVQTLTRLIHSAGITIQCGHRVERIERNKEISADSALAGSSGSGFRIRFTDPQRSAAYADAVVVTTGGSPKRSGLSFLDDFPLDIVEPVPSLFSFCLPDPDITRLMGTVVNDVGAGLAGSKFRTEGALLVTHWGVSGPAILKLSSYAARFLHDNRYQACLCLNWCGTRNETEVRSLLAGIATQNPHKQLQSAYPRHLNARLWHHLLLKGNLNPEQRWGELGRKGYNRLIATLTNDQYAIDGKNRFKEEFVTCGGIALSNIQPKTLECRHVPGLFFAGEVLDVDAITGGFNLQAAWAMGYTAAKALGAGIS